MLLVVSDLHLGDGGSLEDFLWWGPRPEGPRGRIARAAARDRLDGAFARFLAVKAEQARACGLVPRLLLLGDVFDLWQAQRPRERPAGALHRILEAHPRWVAGLRQWSAAGGQIDYVLGNHDQPMVDPRAWALLREVLPTVNARYGGGWRHGLADEALGLYAEHGHRWDPFNRVRALENPAANPAGRVIVRRFVNAFEPQFPWIDKGETVADTIRLAQAALGGEGLRFGWERLRQALRGDHGLVRAVEPWREEEAAADWQALAGREIAAMNRGVRQALSPLRGATTEPLPSHLRFFLTGHTHHALRARAGAGPERLNTGTWRPVAILENDHQPPAMRQPLTYVQILPDGSGGWEASVRSWAREWGALEGVASLT
ncbi:MAG: hypothetical protein RLY93_05900 [Sumerlaeia bacterium]